MSKELRAAAERLNDRDLADYQGPTGDDTDMRAAIVLSRAYLAEHPADDYETVTEEWLRSVGFAVNEYHIAHAGLLLGDFRRERPEWCLGEEIGRVNLPTRGHVRRLCSALGIELKS